ncbi:MAG: hypothetical protein AB1Z23_09040 [Eubacteriales bacterium]
MIIDFDAKFREYLAEWINENQDKFADPAEMEDKAIDLYYTWLDTPASWIDGVCPKKYFSDNKSADELVATLVEYLNTKVGVPDLLLDSISEKGSGADEALTRLFNLKYDIADDAETEARMIAVNILAETDDSFLFDEYIKLLLDKTAKEEVADLLIERLKLGGEDIKEKILDGLTADLGETIELRCIDILVNFPGDDRIYRLLMKMFNEYTNTSLLAAYMGKFGDERAVKILEEALDWQGINYLDYIEIRNSLEQLGCEVEHIRTFEGDKYYESLKNVD